MYAFRPMNSGWGVLFVCILLINTSARASHTPTTDTPTTPGSEDDDTTSILLSLASLFTEQSQLFTSDGRFLLTELRDFPPVTQVTTSDLINLQHIVRDDDDDGDAELTFIGTSSFEGASGILSASGAPDGDIQPGLMTLASIMLLTVIVMLMI